jgi:hypothetical protein
LTCNDPFFGADPYIKVPESLKDHQCTNYHDCERAILKNP